MELVKIPLLPQWHVTSNNCVSTPDGGFLYISVRSVNYISSIANKTEAPLIRTFNTRLTVVGVDVDPCWPINNSTTDTVGADGDVATTSTDNVPVAIADVGAAADANVDGNNDGGGDEEAGACANVKAINPNDDVREKAVKSLPLRMFAVANQDYSIQIWDFDKGYVIQAHKAHCVDDKIHMDGNAPHFKKCMPSLLISYICNRNILSMDKNNLVIYCVASNTYYRRPLFISKRYIMSTLKCSPYNEHQFAIGCSDGLILLCDLQRMSVLYTLRGHNSPVISLAWNRIVNGEKQQQLQKQQQQQRQECEQKPIQQLTSNISKAEETKMDQSEETKVEESMITNTTDTDIDDIFDIYDYNYLDNEFGTSNDGVMMMTNTMKSSPQNNFICKEREGSSLSTDNFNFTEACKNLQDDIKAAQQQQLHCEQQSDYNSDDADNTDEVESINNNNNNNKNIMVTLDECKQAAALLQQEYPQTFSNTLTISSLSNTIMSNDEQQKESFKQIQQSDDEGSLYGRMADRNVQFVLHQAEVHTMHTKDEHQQQQEKIKEIPVKTDYHHQHLSQHYDLHGGNNKNGTDAIDADVLLASITLDCCVGLWNVNTGSPYNFRKSRGSQEAQNVYVQWMDSNHLLTSSRQGFVKFWHVRYVAEKTTANSTYTLEALQRRTLNKGPVAAFSFCQTKQVLWYMTVSKKIIMEDLQKNEILINLGCVSTNIGIIKECPDNMNKIALGFSDRRIGIIDLSKITPNNIQIDNFVRSIEAPVLSLVWSPDSQKIAYGTTDSRIGVLFLEIKDKPPILLKPSSGKPIYSMCWQENFLFVVCNERVTIYNENSDFKESFTIPNTTGVSSMSVYENYLFIGTQKGQLRLYKWNQAIVTKTTLHKFNCELLQMLELTPRYISDIQWCPISTKPTVAIVSNSNLIYIYNFNPRNGILSIHNKITITSKKAGNSSVKWSYSNANRLITAGLDGAIRVWDLAKNVPSNGNTNNPMELQFIKYFPCPMMSALFMPTDDEIILCVGKSTSLEMLDIRLERHNNNNKGFAFAFSEGTLDKVQWATTALTCNDTNTLIKSTERKQKRSGMATSAKENNDGNIDKDNRTYNIDDICTVINDDIVANKENIPNRQIEEISLLLEKCKLESKLSTSSYLKKPSTLLCLTSKELYKESLDIMGTILSNAVKDDRNTSVKFDALLDTIETGNSNTKESLCLKLFGTRAQAKELLHLELENLQKDETKHVANMFIPQLTANLKDEIIQCVQNKQLTEWHVSQAPTISYGFWKGCCKAFADQLLEQGYTLQAATYMLTIYHSTEAIEILLQKNYYKEALIVARLHLEPDDPLCYKITENWINHLYEHGNLVEASLICLLTNQKERSYECLMKIRKTTEQLELVRNLLKDYSNNN